MRRTKDRTREVHCTVVCEEIGMERRPEDVVNFAAGPAKLPREVRAKTMSLFSNPATGFTGGPSCSAELEWNWDWGHG